MQPSHWKRGEALLVTGAGLIGSLVALLDYFSDARRPTAPVLGNGWWSFSDQGRYLRATMAWAAGRLDPADHWYLPGYPLLAAPFVRLTPSNPFLLPDLALLTATIWLTAALAGWLAPGWRWARSAGAFAALAAVLLPPALDVWVTPWTSTPEAALTVGCLLAVLHLMARPWSWRMALTAGLCCGAIAGVRPVDAAVLAAFAGLIGGFAVREARLGAVVTAGVFCSGILGMALAVTPALAAYWAVNGWHMNAYLSMSTFIGFEWRLLPLRWVTIILSPKPLLPDGHGLIAAFRWLPFGLAGMVAALVAPPSGSTRRSHILVIAAASTHVALYLCYRDLHPQGLWLFYNYHYFKWPLVILALYAVLLLPLLMDRRWPALGTGCVALALLLPWRVELVRQAGPAITAQPGAILRVPPVTLSVFDAIVIPAAASFDAVYSGEHHLFIGPEGTWFSSTADFKLMPLASGLMLTPLRPLVAGSLLLRFGPGVIMDRDPPYLARQRLVYGVPCWLTWRGKACRSAGALSAIGQTSPSSHLVGQP